MKEERKTEEEGGDQGARKREGRCRQYCAFLPLPPYSLWPDSRLADQPTGGSGGVHSACAISPRSSWPRRRRRRWRRRWLQRRAARGTKLWASRGDLATDWRARTCTRSPREPTVRGAPTERRLRSFDGEDTNHAPRRAARAGAFFVFAGLSLAMGSRHVELCFTTKASWIVSAIGFDTREKFLRVFSLFLFPFLTFSISFFLSPFFFFLVEEMI